MKIRITKDCRSTIDGVRLKSFKKGKKYDVRDTVASRLIMRGEAESVPETFLALAEYMKVQQV